VNEPLPALELDRGEDSGVGEINRIVGFHIRAAHGAVYRHFMETFAHLDLTQKQVSVLWLVGDHPGIAQSELAQQLRMDRASTMSVVNKLESREYLMRGRSETDARKQPLTLLPAGEQALGEAKAAIGRNEAWLKSRFTDREIALLKDMLVRIHE
jgi:DNA-binding MarR family transcriptional regulator